MPIGAVVLAAACSDTLTPTLSVQLGRSGRNVSVRSDSLGTPLDSVQVVLSGPGADAAQWTALHAGDGAVTLVTSSGGTGEWLRWMRDETVPPGGEPFVDTVVVIAGGAGPALLVESLTVRLMPTRFITVKRAWLPGERDSVIARIVAQRGLVLPYVGDISDNAASLIPADSATEIVPNPLFPGPTAGAIGPWRSVMATVPGVGWQIFGIKIHTVNNYEGGAQLNWIGYVFYNGADPTWKGIVLAASGAAAVNKVVNTPSFDASAGTSGAGGGEIQASSVTYWQANGLGSPNRIRVTASNFNPPATTVTTGPFLGGTQESGLMTGSLETIVMTRVLGSAGTAADTANITVSDLASTFYECIFPTPCTTNQTPSAPPMWIRRR